MTPPPTFKHSGVKMTKGMPTGVSAPERQAQWDEIFSEEWSTLRRNWLRAKTLREEWHDIQRWEEDGGAQWTELQDPNKWL
jgi:hypothetical protein